jgi:hypothetical protein
LKVDLKELESFPQPKRVRGSEKSLALTSDIATDSHMDRSIPLSNSPLQEIIRCIISALLPDYPTAVLPK